MDVFEQVISQASRKPNTLGRVVERRRHKRVPTLRSSRSSITSHLWELELVPAFALTRLTPEIDELAKRSVDRNIFFGSQILLSAWPRLTSLMAPNGVWMLCLWETTGEQRELRLFMPVRRQITGLPRRESLQALSHHVMPLGTPLICKDCAEEAAETLLRLLGDPALGLPPVLEFPHLRQSESSIQLIKSAADRLGLKHLENSEHKRAALVAPSVDKAGSGNGTALRKKRLRELARQKRKLQEIGPIVFEVAEDQEAVLDAFENFLTLELKGWKGRYGTALYNQKKMTSFSRQTVANLVTIDGCQIYSMKQGGKTIASLIMLGHDDDLFPWKMAFDEKLSTYSPGMQLMHHTTNTVLGRSTFKQADSLAVADHWMMNRVWPDRISISDLAIALSSNAEPALERYIDSKLRYVKIRAFIKNLITRLIPNWQK